VLSLVQVERLFPTLVPYEAIRMRMPPAAQIISNALSALTVDQLFAANPQLVSSTWYPHSYETIKGENVSSWQEFFPPNVRKGDNMSSVMIDPWSNPFWAAKQGGIIPYADSKPTDLQPPFPVDNILILTDGVCNSGMCDTPLLQSTAITNSQLSMRHAGGASETPG
jgi:hypothetical protein